MRRAAGGVSLETGQNGVFSLGEAAREGKERLSVDLAGRKLLSASVSASFYFPMLTLVRNAG